MRTTAVFGAKNIRFFEIYDVSARTRGGWASADIFQTRKRDQIFAILCGRPSWMAPNGSDRFSCSDYNAFNDFIVCDRGFKHFLKIAELYKIWWICGVKNGSFQHWIKYAHKIVSTQYVI